MFTILVPIDSDETRARAAIDTVTSIPVDPNSTEVVVLNVFEEFDVTDGEGGAVTSDEMFDEDNLPKSVRIAESLLTDAEFSPTIWREHGNVVETIISTADEIEADQIIMAGRSRSPVGKAIFGSTLQGVMSAANQPVTVTLI